MPDFKLFTIDEANRTLPLVRRIVHDLLDEYPRWRQAVARFEIITGGARADWGETRDLVAARDAVFGHAGRINQYLQELESVGCVFKGFDAGLVDFYTLREDRVVWWPKDPDDEYGQSSANKYGESEPLCPSLELFFALSREAREARA